MMDSTSDMFAIDAPHRLSEGIANQARTVGDVLLRRAEATPDRPSLFAKTGGVWAPISWAGAAERARSVARGLLDLGVEIGERVAILGPTQPLWNDFDFGAHFVGAVSVGIYPMQAADQVRYLLEHSESRVVFVSGEDELATVLEAAQGLESLRAIVPWETELFERFQASEPRLRPVDDFLGEPLAEDDLAARQAAIDPESTAILIYTSGTTGPPKAAMISHSNILALLRRGSEAFPFYEDDLLLSFLPMAHATERVLSFYLRVSNGVAAAYASSIGAVLQELGETRPTIFGSVPRIFEKVYGRVQGEMEKKPALVRSIFRWALGVGKVRTARLLAGDFDSGAPQRGETLRERLAHRLVFRKIHAAFGGRVRAFITGAAPISRDILEFLWAVGLPIYEAYGMTEATVVTHINRPGGARLGSVGRPIPPMEHRIAEDGEILLRGPLVFQGYFKNEAASRETLEGGWLHTGDIGEIDADDFLRITDRKKHLIITAGGKNVAPANIERAIKEESPLISQVHAHGDRRAYISALIAPSPLETLDWGVRHDLLPSAEYAALEKELLANPSARTDALNTAMARIVADRRFQKLFIEPVRRGNRNLARVERVRRFFLLDRDFSQETGELTPTLKVKRSEVEKKFADLFDQVYDDPDFALEAEPGG